MHELTHVSHSLRIILLECDRDYCLLGVIIAQSMSFSKLWAKECIEELPKVSISIQ